MSDNPWIKADASGVGACVEQRRWEKASASSGAGACVEQAAVPGGGVEVRDSKNPDGPVLTFTGAEYAAWLDGAKRGEFDHLV